MGGGGSFHIATLELEITQMSSNQTSQSQSTEPRSPARASGKDLVPDLTKSKQAISDKRRYWVGSIPACPSESIDIAGISFPKINAQEIADVSNPGSKKLVPYIGSTPWITREQFNLLLDRLPRTVIRFTEPPRDDEPEAGGLVDAYTRPRKGQVITIPTKDEIDARRKAGRAVHHYTPGPLDEPAARYLFAKLCDDQKRGSRLGAYPDVLEKTGLEWPKE